MLSSTKLAWLQLRQQSVRLLVAISGVAFAVILIFMQLGFQDALFQSAVTVHSRLKADIVLISPSAPYLVSMAPFPRRRLYQAAAFPGVEDVMPIYALIGPWRNHVNGKTRGIFVIGFDPSDDALAIEGVENHREQIRYPDRVLFDSAARPEYGPVAEFVGAGEPVETELNRRGVEVVGNFQLGTSFGVDGTVITSDLNFFRIFPQVKPSMLTMGLIRLEAGADAEEVRAAIDAELPEDVVVLTKEQYLQQEINYWATATPIGYVFTFGTIMGLVVGAIIVYQILFADISDHLAEYATLKAVGYSSRFLMRVVLMEALILAITGYIPGILISWQLYRLTASATLLPMQVTPYIASVVFGLTVAMCWISALIAVRKVRTADPAEIF